MGEDVDHGDDGFLQDDFINDDQLDSIFFAWAPLCPLFPRRISSFSLLRSASIFRDPICNLVSDDACRAGS